VSGAAGQAYHGLRNVQALAESGGMTLDDVGHLTVLIQDYADLPAIDREWNAMFPDANDRPARQIMQVGLQRRSRAQFHMLAVSST
jgi:2-iminobutanoate/2-iminopropanoate deaminase